MARERLLFGSWEITEGNTRDWEVYDGLDVASPYQGSNAAVPGMPGEIWTPKQIGPGSFTVSVWLYGANRGALLAGWQTLLRAVRRPHRLIDVHRFMPDGEERVALAEASGTIEPVFSGDEGAQAQITFTVPGGTWESVAVYGAATPAGPTLPVMLPLPDLTPSTAPLDKSIFTVTGPITNPAVIDYTDGGPGAYWRYVGSIPAGQNMVVDSGSFSIYGLNGFVPNVQAMTYSGPRFLSVPAAPPGGTPAVRLEGAGKGATTRLQVSARRAYAC